MITPLQLVIMQHLKTHQDFVDVPAEFAGDVATFQAGLLTLACRRLIEVNAYRADFWQLTDYGYSVLALHDRGTVH